MKEKEEEQEGMTIEDVRSLPDFSHLTDEEAQKVAYSLEQFAHILWEVSRKKRF